LEIHLIELKYCIDTFPTQQTEMGREQQQLLSPLHHSIPTGKPLLFCFSRWDVASLHPLSGAEHKTTSFLLVHAGSVQFVFLLSCCLHQLGFFFPKDYARFEQAFCILSCYSNVKIWACACASLQELLQTRNAFDSNKPKQQWRCWGMRHNLNWGCTFYLIKCQFIITRWSYQHTILPLLIHSMGWGWCRHILRRKAHSVFIPPMILSWILSMRATCHPPWVGAAVWCKACVGSNRYACINLKQWNKF
jgi:hypothetical protein